MILSLIYHLGLKHEHDISKEKVNLVTNKITSEEYKKRVTELQKKYQEETNLILKNVPF